MIWQCFCPGVQLAGGSQAPPQHQVVSRKSHGRAGQNTAAFRLEEKRENSVEAFCNVLLVLARLMPSGSWQEGEQVCSCTTTPGGTGG